MKMTRFSATFRSEAVAILRKGTEMDFNRTVVAHLNMDVDTDQGVKVDINAGREALMYMLSAVFAEMMDDGTIDVLELYTLFHCITEHACDNTVRELTPSEQHVLEQVRSRGFELMDEVRANTTH